jgi:cytosine/adenosine deaminase-related metal-dependent hydrolase
MGQLSVLPGERVIEARDCVVYPAWVNTHHHLFQSLLKGEPQGLDLTLTPWLAATPYRFRAGFDEHSFRLAARIGLVELLRSGCGTVADHNYLYYPGMPYDGSAILFEEAEKLGLRFVLCRGGATRTRQLESELPQALRPESLDHFLTDCARLTSRYHQSAPDAMRRVVMAPTTPLFHVAGRAAHLRARSALGIRLHSHLSETVEYQNAAREKYDRSPVAFCGEYEWLGRRVVRPPGQTGPRRDRASWARPAPASPTARKVTDGWAAASPIFRRWRRPACRYRSAWTARPPTKRPT